VTAQQRLLGVVMLGLLGVVLPAAQGQQAKPQQKRNSRQATEADYRALAQQSEVVGRLLSVDADTNSQGLTQQLTLSVDYIFWELKPGASLQAPQAQRQMQHLLRNHNQQQLQREYEHILRIRNPVQQQQRLAQLFARLQMQQPVGGPMPNFNPRNSPFRPVTQTVTFELPVQSKVRVARAKPPLEYDDKGRIIELKPEELRKRKDPEMPGYKASWADLLPGDIIKVYLARPQKKKDTDKKDGDKDATANKKAVELPELKAEDKKGQTATSDYRPEVRLILILDDSAASAPPAPNANKKKKN
jgi:hypothetical protein